MSKFVIGDIVDVTLAAGDAAMEIYGRDHEVALKEDASPVTEADLSVDRILVSALGERFPAIPVITEERISTQVAASGDGPFFLVDPIDGTKEFILGTGEFTINIALIENRTPTAGIVYAPAVDRLFVGQIGSGARELSRTGRRRDIRVRQCSGSMTAIASRSHLTPETKAFISANKIEHCVNAGSSLKFCLVAAGEADIYPRLGPTMEWDTAAGHAVLAASGGQVLTCEGAPLSYGKPEFRNPFFIASSLTATYSIPAPGKRA
ncbi:3'(2'),5'-bisphosphate nucleotidase CysQ [Oricola cellulosilytica]|uniref:3'(2'),5'-bisphosphate nucleotidase CysQ n=1 Tax=Oricola cellulosilytica TaxID=1429082 RepID=A0A4R0PC55_9HYPH|nr:3'(2'),5'-bisphosphate nucleotidase CysQ [Oricola cellulosilytica]TCD14048.1 3'(2'),5'-bisphosphate nucleotidase [Oricola cellulosilytica]